MDHSTYIYGIRYPNRVFVGGLPREATATDLADFFSKFGQVTESKVILNDDGTSKGYGFITFATAKDVENVFGQGVIFYKKKKLNIGPAIRKQAPETPGEPIYMLNLPPQTQLPPSPPPKTHSPSPPNTPPSMHPQPSQTVHPQSTQTMHPQPTQTMCPQPNQTMCPQPSQSAHPQSLPMTQMTQHCYQSLSVVNPYPQAVPSRYVNNFQWYPIVA